MTGAPDDPGSSTPAGQLNAVLDAWCNAATWGEAADLLTTHREVLLGEEMASLAEQVAKQYAGREFELVPHRLRVLAQCRTEPAGDVMVGLVAGDELGAGGDFVLTARRAVEAPEQTAAVCTELLTLPLSPTTRGLVLMTRAHANLAQPPTAARSTSSINDLQQAQQLLPAETQPRHHADLRQALGEARRRLETGDPAAEIDRAIADLEASMAAAVPRSLAAANAMNSLGDAYSKRILGDRADNLIRATRLLHSAFVLYEEQRDVLRQAATARNIASLESRRDDQPPHRGLIEAFRWSQRAAELFERAGAPLEVARTHADLGSLCVDYANRQKVPAYYLHAIDLITEAGDEWATLDPTDYAAAQSNIGAALLLTAGTRQHEGPGEGPGDGPGAGPSADGSAEAARRAALVHFGRALEHLDEDNVQRRTLMLSSRGVVHLQLDELSKAAADLTAAADLSDIALSRAEHASGEMELIRRVPETFRLAALTCALLGRSDDAFQLVERGRARLLSRELATSAVCDATAVPDGSALVSVTVSANGTVVVVIPSGVSSLDERNVLLIPEFTGGRLRQLTVGTREGTYGWLMRTMLLSVAETDTEYRRRIEDIADGVDEIVAALAAELVAPIAERLEALGVADGTPVLLSPDGELATLPLHAVPVGQGLFGERWPVTLTPSLTVTHALRARIRPLPTAARALSVVDETGTLPLAEAEVARLEQLLPAGASTRLGRTARLKDAYDGEEIVHFAVHGRHEWSRPGGSSLEVHAGVLLTADEIAELDLTGCRMVFLSACESGLNEFLQVDDEFLGLPMAFLRAGVGAVICALWRVADLPTALFADAFYHALLETGGAGSSPGSALRQAGRQLRDRTAAELLAANSWLGPRERNILGALDPDSRPFARPFAWAGFVCVGA